MSTSTVVHRQVLSADALHDLHRWIAAIEGWPAGSHVWGHYAEATPSGPVICRTENVSACHRGLADLVDGPLRGVAESAVGQPLVAFKDKVNYKQPGGAGFSPHQDLAAYPGVAQVMSVLLAVDECSEQSGCLWMADPAVDVLPTDDRGVIVKAASTNLAWWPAALGAGDAVCIDGLAPHHSGPNRSARPRRVFIASYAPAAEHYDRFRYYSERRSAMTAATARDGRARISTLADFDGEQLEPGVAERERCTHAPVD